MDEHTWPVRSWVAGEQIFFSFAVKWEKPLYQIMLCLGEINAADARFMGGWTSRVLVSILPESCTKGSIHKTNPSIGSQQNRDAGMRGKVRQCPAAGRIGV